MTRRHGLHFFSLTDLFWVHPFSFCFMRSSILSTNIIMHLQKINCFNERVKVLMGRLLSMQPLVRVALFYPHHLKYYFVAFYFLSSIWGKANVWLFLCRILLSLTNKLPKLSTHTEKQKPKHHTLSSQHKTGTLSFLKVTYHFFRC